MMIRIKDALSRLEARLQSLVEGGSARLFPKRFTNHNLLQALVEAMQAGVKHNKDGLRIAPNLYTLALPPAELQALQSDSTQLEELARQLQHSGEAAGLKFVSPVVIRLVAKPDGSGALPQAIGQISAMNLAETMDFWVEADAVSDRTPENAFLIVDGTRVFPLNKPVINIGRRPDNHLVIENSRVSRVHAQLRVVKGRYMIFDLDSAGGTFVNDQRVQQSVLYPGDVISLAGVPLVFGQDDNRLGKTQKLT